MKNIIIIGTGTNPHAKRNLKASKRQIRHTAPLGFTCCCVQFIMGLEIKIPCKGCVYNTFEDENNVFCKFTQIYGDGKSTSICTTNNVKNKLEIVPKSIFYEKDSTCAAMSYR